MRLKLWLFLIFIGSCYGLQSTSKSTSKATTTTVGTTKRSFRGSKTTTTTAKTPSPKFPFSRTKTTPSPKTTATTPTLKTTKKFFKNAKTSTKFETTKTTKLAHKFTRTTTTPRTTTIKATKFPIREPKSLTTKLTFKKSQLLQKDFAAGTMDFQHANFTKRPLNFYITANAVHVTLSNKTLEIEDGSGKLEIQYRLAQPPFSIKNRGSIVLLGYENFNSWQQGRPNIQQMLAASGHTVYFLDLSSAMKIHKSELFTKILDELKISSNFTLISPDSTGIFTIPFLNRMPYPENFEAFIPAAICCTNLLKNAKFVKIPVLVLESNGHEIPRHFDELPNFQLVHIQSAEEPWNAAENFAQPIINFLDFIHPR